MSVRLELGRYPHDTKLMVDGVDILPRFSCKEVRFFGGVTARERPRLELEIVSCPVSIEMDPMTLVEALREEAARIESLAEARKNALAVQDATQRRLTAAGDATAAASATARPQRVGEGDASEELDRE